MISWIGDSRRLFCRQLSIPLTVIIAGLNVLLVIVVCYYQHYNLLAQRNGVMYASTATHVLYAIICGLAAV